MLTRGTAAVVVACLAAMATEAEATKRGTTTGEGDAEGGINGEGPPRRHRLTTTLGEDEAGGGDGKTRRAHSVGYWAGLLENAADDETSDFMGVFEDTGRYLQGMSMIMSMPVAVPTNTPTVPPTDAPTDDPTGEPTGVPTDVPTAAPTTPAPTDAPVTPGPTPSPTLALVCDISVNLTCTTTDGSNTDCNDLEVRTDPDGCAVEVAYCYTVTNAPTATASGFVAAMSIVFTVDIDDPPLQTNPPVLIPPALEPGDTSERECSSPVTYDLCAGGETSTPPYFATVSNVNAFPVVLDGPNLCEAPAVEYEWTPSIPQ